MAKGIFNSFFGGIDDETEDYQPNPADSSVKLNPRKVLSMSDKRIPDSKINIVEPRIFADAKNISNKLMTGNAVLIKMENVDNATVRRIVDFFNRHYLCIDGNLQQIDDKVYLCAPKNFAVDGDVKQQFYDRNENKN
ncbi:cell division protein SepF [Fructilactobacillus florum]|uniref:cell division protein SepF n=1 Tax=Fructilactobacillus florum TaxID=640331 RepID=UPI0006D1DEFC|nr:cell division protein SepF [Fructilactobacillus florum]